ncbi:MAG: preprotein translocase subunit SecA [Candidatus Wallbacteria bacterium]
MGIFDSLVAGMRYLFNKSDREVRRCMEIVHVINGLEPEMQKLTDEQLQAKTPYFKERLAAGETLDDILPEAFAAVREASRRVLNMRHFDVQLIGGIVLHKGKIAEMKTGEGKTLVATLPLYLNALSGLGVHLVTVNEYLARRDSEWMGQVYKFMGLSVGLILNNMDSAEKREAYNADITYGTNSEFGFDYLRNNMAVSPDELVQRDFNFAIVDEVDSILIDEARTPLIISGPAENATAKYYEMTSIAKQLRREVDFQVDEKSKTVSITEEGVARVEKLCNISNWYDPGNIKNVHLLHQALKANNLFKLDRDYVVKDGEVIIVDEFTGRLMFGRRYSEGLHQSIEAKEGVKVLRENQTLATITLQNYFRMYKKLGGMTGTAETEAREFEEIYKLQTVVIPTNKTISRDDAADVIFRTEKEKYNAVADEIERVFNEKKQPLLVGTTAIDKSELLADMLKKRGINCSVLNAKHHEKEAEIVKEAGKHGGITIATNMAGRGTDIVLDDDARKAGGLYVIGTERHESRRIDNQLRGRSGRQGDPGISRFFLSLEDDLLRLFGSDKISGIMESLGMEEGVPIESGLVSRAIESAQKRVEARNFDIRKHVLKYDDVMNSQRDAIYKQRQQILKSADVTEVVLEMFEELIEDMIVDFIDFDKYDEDREYGKLSDLFYNIFGVRIEVAVLAKYTQNDLYEMLLSEAKKAYELKRESIGGEVFVSLQKYILLKMIDDSWKEHLTAMDDLEEGIGLRAYGQKDPLVEYKIEGTMMFEQMIEGIKENCVSMIFKLQPIKEEVVEEELKPKKQVYFTNRDEAETIKTVKRDNTKIGRNDMCPCGSGKKYKKCCGA